MEVTIHVRIGEGGEVLGGILLLEAHVLIPLEWLHLVEFLVGATLLHRDFNLFQVLQTWLLFCFFNHWISAEISYTVSTVDMYVLAVSDGKLLLD